MNSFSNPELVRAYGEVVKATDSGIWTVRMPNGHELAAFFEGKNRKDFIPRLPGEKVLLEISPYDLSRGRIVAELESSGSDLISACGSGVDQSERDEEHSRQAPKSRLSDLTVASGEAIPLSGFAVPGCGSAGDLEEKTVEGDR